MKILGKIRNLFIQSCVYLFILPLLCLISSCYDFLHRSTEGAPSNNIRLSSHNFINSSFNGEMKNIAANTTLNCLQRMKSNSETFVQVSVIWVYRIDVPDWCFPRIRLEPDFWIICLHCFVNCILRKEYMMASWIMDPINNALIY